MRAGLSLSSFLQQGFPIWSRWEKVGLLTGSCASSARRSSGGCTCSIRRRICMFGSVPLGRAAARRCVVLAECHVLMRGDGYQPLKQAPRSPTEFHGSAVQNTARPGLDQPNTKETWLLPVQCLNYARVHYRKPTEAWVRQGGKRITTETTVERPHGAPDGRPASHAAHPACHALPESTNRSAKRLRIR